MSRPNPSKQQIIPAEEQIGARIAQARRRLSVRERRDVSGADMARDLGVSTETVRSWEAGESFPRKAALGRLADYLGVGPEWIQYGIEGAHKTLAPNPSDDEDLTASESDEEKRGHGG